MTSPAALSALPQAAFVAALDGIYEHSPWVAEAAWHGRPFASLAALHAGLAQAVAAAAPERQVALLRAHPELAGRAAIRGELTDLSTGEQGRAGLDRCTPDEFARLTELNAAYGKKFGFPFIIAVRGLAPADIVEAMAVRLASPCDSEMQEGLRQVDRIAELRLCDRFGDAAP